LAEFARTAAFPDVGAVKISLCVLATNSAGLLGHAGFHRAGDVNISIPVRRIPGLSTLKLETSAGFASGTAVFPRAAGTGETVRSTPGFSAPNLPVFAENRAAGFASSAAFPAVTGTANTSGTSARSTAGVPRGTDASRFVTVGDDAVALPRTGPAELHLFVDAFHETRVD